MATRKGKKAATKAPAPKKMWEAIAEKLPTQTREQQTRMARQATQWLGDPTLDRVIAMIRTDCIEQWRVSRDPETRERAWLMLHSVDLLVSKLTGIVANEQIEQEQTKRADARELQEP